MGQFRYPLPVTRTRYITEVGGRSSSLAKNQIGLHAGAIMSNTSLSFENDILVDKAGRKDKNTPRPLYARTAHKLKPLTELDDSRALAMANDGEAVLSVKDPLEVEEGDGIILKTDVNSLPENWIERLIRKRVNKR